MILNKKLLISFVQDCDNVFGNTGFDSFIEYCNHAFKKTKLSRIETIVAAMHYSNHGLAEAAKILNMSPEALDAEANKYGLL